MTQSTNHSLVVVLIAIGISALTIPEPAEGLGQQPLGPSRGELSSSPIELVVTPMVDVAALKAEDAEREGQGAPIAPRFANAFQVDYSPENRGTWEILNDGSSVWRLRIASPGALSINLGLDRFHLSSGAEFCIYNADGTQVQGPYTAKDRNAAGGLWTALILGDEMVAELHLPSGAEADLRISSVNHGYRFFGDGEARPYGKRGSCNINVACPDGDPWRDQIQSVARITISGMYICSGQLINNTAQDGTPYFLTAGHCIEAANEAPTVVAYWNFQSPACDDFDGGNLGQNQSGSTWVASSPLDGGTGSDFTLVELDDDPNPSWNVFFVGWDAREQTPSSTTTIHHPSGDEKSISFDYDPPTITPYLQDGSLAGATHWRIGDWDEGTTEGGSSGACLFDSSTKRCIGTLSGGYAACANNDPDWYARTASQWTGGGTDETRLSTWLDPENTGLLTFPGSLLSEFVFADGFESADTSSWSSTVPPLGRVPRTHFHTCRFLPAPE